eukprot:gene12331-2980_t
MSDNMENSVNAYVAGLRQLLENIEPIIRQANSLAAVEDILLNLETTDENFHKYDLVKMLRQLIEVEIGPLIDGLVDEGRLDQSESECLSAISEEILSSEAFNKVSMSVVSAIQAAANEIIKVMTENGGNFSLTHSSLDKYQRFSNRYLESSGDDSLLASSFDGDDFMFMSPQKYNVLANQLLPDFSPAKRLEALNTLSQIPQTDLVNSEFWNAIKKGLSYALKDDNHIIAEKSLKFHAKVFATASGHVTKEIYNSLTNHLIDYFKESTSHMVSIDTGLDLGDRRNIKILKELRLLNQFQHELPLFWIRYPEKFVEEILFSTVNLMSVIPQPVSSNFSEAVLSPYHFLSLIDPSAFWFCKWMHGNYSRAELIKHLSSNKILLKEACKSSLDFVLHCKTQFSPETGDDVEIVNHIENEALVYTKAEILCAHFIQSISILGRIILYKEGRALFPIELEDRLETITVPDLIVMLVEVISFLPPSSSDLQSLNDLEPAHLVANILKNLATGSAETCLDCICKDVVMNAFLQPVHKSIEGYNSVLESKERNEATLVLTADILAEIASTHDGRNHLLYGERKERWQRSRLAPVHTIAQFAKKALNGSLETKPSDKVISSFLFVCRQLYNTCEGLMIMGNFTHSDIISKALLRTREIESCDSGRSKTKINQTHPPNIIGKTFAHLSPTSSQDIENAFNPLNFGASSISTFEENHSSEQRVVDYVTEADLVSMSESLHLSSSAVPQSSSFVKPQKKGYTESLIDNLLNFTSTPKGVLLVQQTGILDECAQYMNSRYQQKLQVSKIEKFGYGAMITQMTATAPGMLALERAGYFEILLENTWQCLEGVTNDYTKTVLSSDWDDIEEKQCKKLFTSMINLLSSFPSVYELLCIQQAASETANEHISSIGDPVTRTNAFSIPKTFEELMQNLVFVDSSDRMRLLFQFERSHLFGLRVLSSLVSCLDTFLLIQSKYHFQETLLMLQESQKIDNGQFIIDNCGVERNQILVRTFSIGGPTERIIPGRTLAKDPESPYPWPFFSSYPVPSAYVPVDLNVVMTAFEQQDKVRRFLTETGSNTFDTLEEARGWLLKCRDVYVSTVKEDPETVGMKSIPHLMERICSALAADPEEAILPLIEYSGNESLLKSMQLSDMENIGVDLVIKYGTTLRLIPPTSNASEELKHLLKQCKFFLSCQQRQFSSKLSTLQSDYAGFDCVSLINAELESFVSLAEITKKKSEVDSSEIHLPKDLQESGIHPMYSS